MAVQAKSATEGRGARVEFGPEFLKKLELLNIVARKILAGLLRADRQSPRRGSSAEFADHRSYVAGDDIRRVDWHLFGRLEELFLKLYREEENLHFTVLIDTSLSMDFGGGADRPDKLGFAQQVAAALAYIGMSNLDSSNVVPFDSRLREGVWGLKGRGRVLRLFDYLRGLQPEGTSDLALAMREFVARERRRGVVVVISDFYDLDGFQQALRYLKYPKHDIYAIHVVDAAEEEPDLRGDLRLVDHETGHAREINVTDGLKARYREAFAALGQGVVDFCRQNEIGYARARTDTPFDELVLRILRSGGLIG